MLDVRKLIVGGVEIPIQASHTLNQTYKVLQAAQRRRFLNGDLWQRKTWGGKLETNITGTGIMPSGFQEVDFDNPIVIACVEALGINSVSNVIVLPVNRRADAGSEPQGYAIVDGELVETTINVVGDTATLGIVAGASQYQARYFPLITCMAEPPEEDLTRGSAYGWSLIAEEV